MAWNSDRARDRIERHKKTAPTVDADITFSDHRRLVRAELARAKAAGRFPTARAVPVEGVHLYGQLLDFDDVVVDGDRRETLASHARVLEFLHVHYWVWDSIVDGDDALRVDFHGPRLHAVITEPKGDPREQVRRAVALAAKLAEAANRVGLATGFPSRTRFGIDYGMCLALTTGRSHDTDTLFLGSPANHAAKLVAKENVPGIYLRRRAQETQAGVGQDDPTRVFRAAPSTIESAVRTYRFDSVDRAAVEVIEGAVRTPGIGFWRPRPPLKDLKFADLSPSRTARMGMASIFADVDRFTPFVDNAIGKGPRAIQEAVVAIHVIREGAQ